MNNKMLIENKQGIIQKIILFFRNIFKSKEQKNITSKNKKEISSEINKKDFLELYKKVKKDEIDLFSLDEKTLKMIYILIQEEIELVDKTTLEKKQRIKEIEAKLNNKD